LSTNLAPDTGGLEILGNSATFARTMAAAFNIGASGRRRRYIIGGVALLVGVALAAALVLGGAPQGARFLVFLPFAVGALGILQARGQT
jgi:hypothetical protein